jgi:hypothetical protein
MKHHILCLAFLVAEVGCFSPDDGGGGYGAAPRSRHDERCSRLTTCGTCTPVLGCGWCWSGDKGLCADQPNDCAAEMSFDWTWEASGCPAEGDGGASDAGTTPDAGTAPDGGSHSASDAAAEGAGAG